MLVLALQRPVTSCMLVMSQFSIGIVVKVYHFSGHAHALASLYTLHFLRNLSNLNNMY